MNELAVFDEVAATITEYKAKNKTLVFNYADKEGAKAAKSHIMKLRKVKTKISAIHKEAKAEALAFGRRLDAKKNEYISKVDEMVYYHQKPLDDIQAEITAKAMEEVRKREEAAAKELADLQAREAAVREAEDKIAREKAEVEAKIAKEKADAAEKIAAEKARVERAEREKRIAEEATATAKKQAEEAAERAIIQAEQKRKAEADAKELAEKKQKEAKEAAEKKRIEDKAHRMKIESEIHFCFTDFIGLQISDADIILAALKENKVPHVAINY